MSAAGFPSSPSRYPAISVRALGGALAATVTLALACTIFGVGFLLATHDQVRSHLPGHWIYRALVVAPSLVQLAYVIPAWCQTRTHQKPWIARGIAVGAGVAFALNAAGMVLVSFMATSQER